MKTLEEFLNKPATRANVAAILATAERDMDELYAQGGHVLDENHVPIFDRRDVELNCTYGDTLVVIDYRRKPVRRRRPYRIYWVADQGRWHMDSDDPLDAPMVSQSLDALVTFAHGGRVKAKDVGLL